jgi:hypothetical protein
MSRKRVVCEFDDGRPGGCGKDADYLVSARDEHGLFRANSAFCKEHLTIYAQEVNKD